MLDHILLPDSYETLKSVTLSANSSFMATDFNQFIKHPAVKIIAFILTFFIVAVVLVGLFTNKHIKVWFIEFNSKEVAVETKKDSVYGPHIPIAKSDSLANKETKSNPATPDKQSDLKENKKPDTVTAVQGKNVTINTPIQTRPTQREVNEINKHFPDKDTKVVISWESGNKRAEGFAAELITLLKTNGYKKVDWSTVVGNFSAEPIGLVILKSDPGTANILVHL